MVTNQSNEAHNPNWPLITGDLYRTLIVGGSGSRKANALLNLINHQFDTDADTDTIINISNSCKGSL